MFNHSCRPNVTWCMLPSGKVLFVCSKDVEKGKPLSIPYVPEHTPKHRESLNPGPLNTRIPKHTQPSIASPQMLVIWSARTRASRIHKY